MESDDVTVSDIANDVNAVDDEELLQFNSVDDWVEWVEGNISYGYVVDTRGEEVEVEYYAMEGDEATKVEHDCAKECLVIEVSSVATELVFYFELPILYYITTLTVQLGMRVLI